MQGESATHNALKVALVGYGYAGQVFHAPLIRATSGMRLAMVISSDAQKVHADFPDVQVVDDLIEACNDPSIDLVVIATPNICHFTQAAQALMAGKHVVVDKPFTVTLSQAEQLQQIAQNHGRILSVFHNRRWDSDFLSVRQLMREGRLGQIVTFESHFDRYRPLVRDRWRERAGEGSGLWFDLGPHLLDQAVVLFGMPQAIQADITELRPAATTTDYFHVTLYYPSLRVILHSTMLSAGASPRYQIHGTEGSYIKYGLDPQESCLKAGRYPPHSEWGYDMNDGWLTLSRGNELLESPLLSQLGNYPAYYLAVCDAINGKGDNPVTAEEAIDVMRLLEAGIESVTQQRVITLSC